MRTMICVHNQIMRHVSHDLEVDYFSFNNTTNIRLVIQCKEYFFFFFFLIPDVTCMLLI